MAIEVDKGPDKGHEDDHHNRGGQGWGVGIVNDFKRTVGTNWCKEMINLNGKTIACSFFLYFACISPAVTFGAIYGKATNNNIGAVEMIGATAWCGIVYALLGGQPMMINGGTGPVLAFSEILYKISKAIEVPFLTLNAWIGIWVFAYMLLAAFVDLNRIIILCTRFTDEIFSFLIALIFIINAVGSPFSKTGVLHYFDPDHKAHDPYEDKDYYSHNASALLAIMVTLGTTYLAFRFKEFKFSPFFPNQTFRNTMTDFAVVLSILIWSIVGNSFSDIPIEKLNVPDKFAPTFQCCDASCRTSWPNECEGQEAPYGSRPWLVDLWDLNGKGWVPFMAAGPAILAFVLIFLDDGITWHLINHPSHKLTHGDAYNYDTIVVAVLILVNSFFGLPWLVAATVRSLNHILAMAEKTPDGQIVSVQETRLTHLGIHLLCLATIFALDVLKLIPVPVLYGVFLFMGLSALGTNQFWGRMLMFFMQPSKYPVQPYTQYMKSSRMHLFTCIQLFFFASLYIVKSIKAIAIAFPILIAACIPVRIYLLPMIFNEDELILIDSDPNTVKMWIANKQAEGQIDGAEKGDDDDNKDTDQSTPTAGSESPSAQSSRRNRAKTLSCPTGALMFSEQPSMLGPKLMPQMVVGDNAGMFFAAPPRAMPTVADDSIEMADVSQQGRRARASRDQRRSNSCPVPNMFFGVELVNPTNVRGTFKEALPAVME